MVTLTLKDKLQPNTTHFKAIFYIYIIHVRAYLCKCILSKTTKLHVWFNKYCYYNKLYNFVYSYNIWTL